MYDGHKIGIVVLAYMVEDPIKDVVEGLPDFVDGIYVVDDGSTDRTAEAIGALKHPRLKLIKHATNRGPGAALVTGYKMALEDGMDITVKVDGDGQMPPEQIERLITPIIDGKADYTKGDRISNTKYRRNMPCFRLLGNLMLTWLTRIASGYWRLSDSQNGFTAISRAALQKIDLKLYPYYGYLNDILVQLNVHSLRVLDVPMPARYGKQRSHIRLRAYVLKVSLLLLRRLLWRLKKKYFK